EHNPIIRRKQERSLGREAGKGIVGLVTALPDLPSVAACGLRHPNRPGHDASRNQGQFFLNAGHADKSNLPAVRRPARIEIAIDAGGEVTYRVAPEVINRDETVILAMADKSDLASVGRPLGIEILAAHIGQLVSRRGSGYGRDPQVFARISIPSGLPTDARSLLIEILAAHIGQLVSRRE